jgi:hypothetical protein
MPRAGPTSRLVIVGFLQIPRRDGSYIRGMARHARGRFEVKLTPIDASPEGKLAELGRMSIDKTFSGDLEGRSTGEMLAFRSRVDGSAGYVAIERVDGTLGGRRGTFVLQHDGRRARGAHR